MKIETKRKIIHFISKLIKYKEYEEVARPFMIKRWQVNHTRSQLSFKEEEIARIPEVEIKNSLQQRMIKELDRVGAIKYNNSFNKRTKLTEITAELRFISSYDNSN